MMADRYITLSSSCCKTCWTCSRQLGLWTVACYV